MFEKTKESLLDDVIKIAHHAAQKKFRSDTNNIEHQYVTQDSINHLDAISQLAMRRNQYTQSDFNTDPNKRVDENRTEVVHKGFGLLTEAVGKLEGDEVKKLSRITALDSIVVNAVGSAERASAYIEPKKQIATFLTDYMKQSTDKVDALKTLQDKMGTLLISLVDTKHPTIYHAPEASAFEASLSGILEAKGNVLKSGPNDPLRLSEAGKTAVVNLLDSAPDVENRDLAAGFLQKLAKEDITIAPKRQLTVAIENKAQVGYGKKMQQQVKAVIQAWNDAIAEMEVDGVTNNTLSEALKITPDREKNMIEFRTWGQSADADGRDKSTSSFLYESIRNNIGDNSYNGPTLDMRQNAKKVHLPFISALIQVKQRNSEDKGRDRIARYEKKEQRDLENEGVSFADYCSQFMTDMVGVPQNDPDGNIIRDAAGNVVTEQKSRERKYQELHANGDGLPWLGSAYSIFQQLDAEDRSAFLTGLIEKNYKLLPKQIEVDTLAFNSGVDTTVRPVSPGADSSAGTAGDQKPSGIYEIKKVFISRYKDQIKQAGLDPETIQYDEMGKVTIPHDLTNPEGVQVSLRGAWDMVVKLNGFEILHSGLQYSRLPTVNAPKEAVLDFWKYVNPEQILVQNFLQGTMKAGKTELQPLDEKDRATFNDTAKRLFVINDAIEKYKDGNKVATRYQIANFSEPADFLILLKLFQDTGIAEIEKGRVIQSKLAIQPLLETGEDLKNAPEIFTALLGKIDDPKPSLAKSFWQARGNEAEIMLGFSDGAASVGNFASQWEIYKATQALTELFAQHDIKVRFFQGRGRGTDRGGSIDPRLQMNLMSPEAMQRGIYDVTLQSDLPMDLAASDAYGKDYFTKVLLGTLDATIKAPQRMLDQKGYGMVQAEKYIQWIADRSAEIYRQIVRDDNLKGALAVLMKPVDIPEKTSRAADRGEKNKFDEHRAIPKEYLFNGMDLPIHNVGLKIALEEFEQRNGSGRIKQLNKHPFFNAVTQTIRAGMSNYDPAIARAHGEAMKLEAYTPEKVESNEKKNFVEWVIPHLDGLAVKLDYITGNVAAATKTPTKMKAHLRYLHDDKNLDYVSEPTVDTAQITFQRPSWGSVLDQIAHSILVYGLKKGKPRAPVSTRTDEAEWADTRNNALFVTAQEIGHHDLLWPAKNVEHGVAA